jgi:hypothetical protein
LLKAVLSYYFKKVPSKQDSDVPLNIRKVWFHYSLGSTLGKVNIELASYIALNFFPRNTMQQ